MKFLIALSSFVLFTACSTSPTNSPIVPLQDAGCAIETSITSAFGTALAGATGATSAAACGAAIQVALGNINFCATVSSSSEIKMKGLVGSLVCPLVDSAAIGYLSGTIPPACQGPNSLTATAANAALVAACEAVITARPKEFRKYPIR